MRHLRRSAFRFTCLAFAGLIAGSLSAAEDAAGTAVAREYRSASGAEYFALALQPNLSRQAAVRQHVLLLDTSASQVGKFRSAELMLTSEILSSLPADDTVQIFAVDVTCEALTNGFVKAGSPEAASALEALRNRTPLGATNLPDALKTVVGSLNGHPTSVLYIGDGVTSANLMSVEDVDRVAKSMSANRCSMHSIVLGPSIDLELPAIFANLTGGVVRQFKGDEAGDTASAMIAAMTTAPTKLDGITLDGNGLNGLASVATFARPDRHTVVVGRGSLPASGSLTLQTADGQSTTWSASEITQQNGGAELRLLVERAEASHGVNAPAASLEMLNLTGNELAAFLDQSVKVVKALQNRGRNREAAALATRAADIDDTNRQLNTILTSMESEQPFVFNFSTQEENPFAPPVLEDAPAVQNAPPPVSAGSAQDELDAGFGGTSDPLSEVESQILVRTQQLTQATNAAIAEAVEYSKDRPEYGESLLKDVLATVRSENNVNPAARAELERRLTSALESVRTAAIRAAETRKQQLQVEAVGEAQQKLVIQNAEEEERLESLIDSVRGLLDRARHGDVNGYEDAEAVARLAIDMRPGNGPAAQALVVSEGAGQLDKSRRLQELRHDRFLETLYQVELSHVPFPDEPPIQYPPADVWRALTLTRVPRYKSLVYYEQKPVELWLNRMLDEPVPPLDFPGDAQLSEVLQQISEFYTATYGREGGADYRMTIWPDYAELELEGINSLEEVTVKDIVLNGISLRNALSLIFDQTEEPALTYVIKNEVVQITTLAKAEDPQESATTRVYDVLDIISTLRPVQGGGGGLGGGGLGGRGGGGGGLGGGGLGGGGGGGFGGGGGGFGGGGFGSVPVSADWDAILKADGPNGISNQAIDNVKKKPAVK
ncbi:MAG: hypothetical protein R3C19_05010 [Planctomycetaceae bacterium]